MSDKWDYPSAGGSYVRDDATGALTRVEPPLPVDANPPAPEPDAEAASAEPGVPFDLERGVEAVAQVIGKSKKGTV